MSHLSDSLPLLTVSLVLNVVTIQVESFPSSSSSKHPPESVHSGHHDTQKLSHRELLVPVERRAVDSPRKHFTDPFLTPWPSAAFITNTTHPLMVKLLLSVVAPVLCVAIALQAYVTYFGPSNSYFGDWKVPLSDPAAGWVVPHPG